MTEFRFRPEVVQGGPVLVFRNEEERRQGCRVLATLRESLHDGGPAGSSIPKCGRDCLAQVASRRQTSMSDDDGCEEPSPQIIASVLRESLVVEIKGNQRVSCR